MTESRPIRNTDQSVAVPHPRPEPRRVLMLQGHPSRFWRDLGDGLTAAGIKVHKVHFCLADRVFWQGRRARPYRGRLSDWPDWLERFIVAQGITDILYYADRFPYHIAARSVAERLGIAAWVVEFGYLRPDWLTFERGGMSAHSTFDRSLEALQARAVRAEDPDLVTRYPHAFAIEAVNEVLFGLLSVFGRPFYPRYRSNLTYWPIFDYLSWIPKLICAPRSERHANRIQNRLLAGNSPYYLLPMQIEADYQIRDNSPYAALDDFVNAVMASFAEHASPETRLVIKLHPLDSGLENRAARCRRMARTWGLGDRVDILRGGDLATLLKGARGVVLVNSTVGLHALRLRVPVLACGSAIYDIPGLTHQGSMPAFFTTPEPVDPALLRLFLRALSTIQIKGSFFHPEGRRAAIAEIVARLRPEAARAQVISANRERWRISKAAPTVNSTAPKSSGNEIST